MTRRALVKHIQLTPSHAIYDLAQLIEQAPKVADAPFTLTAGTVPRQDGRQAGLFEAPTCQWFARCDRPATGTTAHPILGQVPTCDRCRRFAEDKS